MRSRPPESRRASDISVSIPARYARKRSGICALTRAASESRVTSTAESTAGCGATVSCDKAAIEMAAKTQASMTLFPGEYFHTAKYTGRGHLLLLVTFRSGVDPVPREKDAAMIATVRVFCVVISLSGMENCNDRASDLPELQGAECFVRLRMLALWTQLPFAHFAHAGDRAAPHRGPGGTRA